MMTIKCYSELIRFQSFEERFKYLKLDGIVGDKTFGFDRYLNQIFYKDREWLRVRDEVIIRDNGCDLGIFDREIKGRILVHHMNPISIEDVLRRRSYILNPEYLISTTKNTHDAIHYGSEETLIKIPKDRIKNDTCPWRRE